MDILILQIYYNYDRKKLNPTSRNLRAYMYIQPICRIYLYNILFNYWDICIYDWRHISLTVLLRLGLHLTFTVTAHCDQTKVDKSQNAKLPTCIAVEKICRKIPTR